MSPPPAGPLNRLVASLYSLKERLEAYAEKPYALHAMFLMALIEASFFPIPVDVLLVALAVARPRSSFRYATVCVAGSVAGAMVGYVLGAFMFDAIGERVVSTLGMAGRFTDVLRMYHDHAFFTLLAAGFTSIPFSVFSLAAGFRNTLDPWTFLLGALAGRVARFYLLGLLLFLFGSSVGRFIDRYLPAVSLLLLVLFAVCLVWLKG